MTKKTKSTRNTASRRGLRSGDEEAFGEGDPDEAAAFIAETAADLIRLARSQNLELLGHLLRMVELEAEEYLRLRGKAKLS